MRETDLSHDLHELAVHMRENSERWFPRLHSKGPDDQIPLHQFYTLGLVGEAGEVANIVKKAARQGILYPEDLAPELADGFTYLLLLTHEMHIDLIGAYHEKEKICEERWG